MISAPREKTWFGMNQKKTCRPIRTKAVIKLLYVFIVFKVIYNFLMALLAQMGLMDIYEHDNRKRDEQDSLDLSHQIYSVHF